MSLTIQQCEVLIRQVQAMAGKVPNHKLVRTLDNLKTYINEISSSIREDILNNIEDSFDVVSKTKEEIERRNNLEWRSGCSLEVSKLCLNRRNKSNSRVASLVIAQSNNYSKVIETVDKDGVPLTLHYITLKEYFQSNLKEQKINTLYGESNFLSTSIRKRANKVRSKALRAARKAKYSN